MAELNENNQEVHIKRICKLILETPEKMIKEKDLLSFVQNNEELFQEVIGQVNSRFEQIGYELIRTTFMEDVFYLLAGSGMDKKLTPQMYGILGLIFSFQREFNRDLTLEESQKIFKSQWQEINFLIENGYLIKQQLKKETFLLITPLGKVLFKDVISNLSLDAILSDLEV